MSVARIDRLLGEAAAAGQVPGVVAMAATADGVAYQGAFGRRSVAGDTAMTADSIFWIASMTKPLTATAALQLIEQGRLSLDQPAGEVLPPLAAPRVLEGFDAAGVPQLRPARRPVTLRHLLTHTAGFAYAAFNRDLRRYAQQLGIPSPGSGQLAALDVPLVHDPGERWEYGISIDWVGRMVEAVSGQSLDAYLRDHVFAPLDMRDTAYVLRPDQQARLAQVHARRAGGALEPIEVARPREWEFFPGGGGLYSTAADYLRFLRMLLDGGRGAGGRVLRADSVALMARNHIGELEVGPLASADPEASTDVELFPGMSKKWGLSFLINTEDAPTGRSAGSLAWAGLGNTYFWLDPGRRVAGVFLTQVLPFGDPAALRLFEALERAIYETVA
jgi:CubicO group peptidase (beta-lactamase class C family)